MRLFKRILLSFLIVFTLFVSGVIIIGTKYEDKLMKYVIEEIGNKLSRPVNVSEIEYKLFSSFPNISVDLVNVETYSFKEEDQPFIKLEKLHLVFDILPLLSGEFNIQEIILDNGVVNVILNEKGDPNYNILKESSDSSSSGSANFKIENIVFNNVNIQYQDLKLASKYQINLNQGNLQPSSLQDSIIGRFIFDGSVPIIQDGDFKLGDEIELSGQFGLSIIDGEVAFDFEGDLLNAKSTIAGVVNLKKNNWNILMSNQSLNIKKLIKVLPEKMRPTELNSASGNISTTLRLISSGKGDSELRGDFVINNGSYKISSSGLTKVDVKGNINQSNISNIQTALISISSYSLVYNNRIQLTGDGVLKNLENPSIKIHLLSELNLEDLHDISLRNSFKVLKGKAKIDIELEGRLIDVFTKPNQRNLNSLKLIGSIHVLEALVQPNQFDFPIIVDQSEIMLANNNIKVKEFKGRIGESHFEMNGTIEKFLNTVFLEKDLCIKSTLKVDQLVLEDFITERADSTKSTENYEFTLPSNIELSSYLELGSFSFRKFNSKDLNGYVNLSNNVLSFSNFSMNTCSGKANLDGSITAKNSKNVIFKCKSDLFDIDAKKAFVQFENFGQDVLLAKHVKGKISISAYLIAEADKGLNIIQDKIYTESKLRIVNGELVDFEPMIELAEFLNKEFKLNFDLKHLKFSTIENNIDINNGTIYIPEMAIRSNEINLDVQGLHSFNQDIDYLLKVKHNEIFKANKKNQIEEEFGVVENNDKTATVPLRMKGTVEEPKFSYDVKTKRKSISDAWKKEGKEIKQALKEDLINVFKVKKDKEKNDLEDLNNGPTKVITTITWDEEEEEELDEEDKID